MCRLKRLGLVVSEKEKNLVVTLAKLEGEISLAALIRKLIYQEAYSKGLLPPISNPTEGDSNVTTK